MQINGSNEYCVSMDAQSRHACNEYGVSVDTQPQHAYNSPSSPGACSRIIICALLRNQQDDADGSVDH